jgi:hypothetical protein
VWALEHSFLYAELVYIILLIFGFPLIITSLLFQYLSIIAAAYLRKPVDHFKSFFDLSTAQTFNPYDRTGVIM